MTGAKHARWLAQNPPPVLWSTPRTRLLREGDPRPSAVYSIYDVEGVVIYVGVAFDPALRVSVHRAARAWGSEADSWSADWYEDRESAEAAEIQAIVAKMPKYNVHGTERHNELMRGINRNDRHKYRQVTRKPNAKVR